MRRSIGAECGIPHRPQFGAAVDARDNAAPEPVTRMAEGMAPRLLPPTPGPLLRGCRILYVEHLSGRALAGTANSGVHKEEFPGP